jgi:drug/metabolite transporter (DMT)-like permease
MSSGKLSDLSLLFVSAVWVNIVAMKFLLGELSPVNLVIIRFFSGTLLLFLLLLFLEDVRISLMDFLYLCVLGVTGITAYQLLFVCGMKYTSLPRGANPSTLVERFSSKDRSDRSASSNPLGMYWPS